MTGANDGVLQLWLFNSLKASLEFDVTFFLAFKRLKLSKSTLSYLKPWLATIDYRGIDSELPLPVDIEQEYIQMSCQ